jgi:ParB/RepB/Spo0J family partition protein
MTEKALESDKLRAPLYLVAKIYNDREFNSRKNLMALDVIDLAKDVAKHGLTYPVEIEPRRDDTPPGYDYKLISGHRRHTAYRINEAEFIPAYLMTGLSLVEAKSRNARENMHRKDLNIAEEADLVSWYKSIGWSRGQIADELGQSPGWVQIREQLSLLPQEIKEEAAAGVLNQSDIRKLYTVKDKKKQFDIVLEIKKSREREEKRTIDDLLPAKNKSHQKKHQSRQDIQVLLAEVQKVLGNGTFLTRALAWASGEIATGVIYAELKLEAKKLGIDYNIPKEYDV